MKNKIIVALDVPEVSEALAMAKKLQHSVGVMKVGLELFTAAGPDVVRELRAMGCNVFLDLKMHDIPNTVAKSVESAVKLGASFLTVHACGGAAMLQSASDAAHGSSLQLLAVTVLTSLTDKDLLQLGIPDKPADRVHRLAKLAVECNVRGLVCSPEEVSAMRSEYPAGVVLVTPGIRPEGSAMNDQKRAATPREAIQRGSDYIVIGRPITAAADPVAAAEAIAASLRQSPLKA